MPTGVYERIKSQKRFTEKELKKHKREYQRKYMKTWGKNNEERRENEMNEGNGEKNILYPAIDFLEKMKGKEKGREDVDVDLINGWQNQVRSLGEAIKINFDEWYKNKHKPVRKVWYMAIKAEEEILKKCEEKNNERIEQLRDEFPNAKITLSLCKDVMIRNELGQFEIIKEEKE